MANGWVMLHRKVLDSGLMRNHKLWTFWTWCLLKASHKETTQLVGSVKVVLQPGQFVFGRRTAAKELGMTEQNVRTCLATLKREGSLTSQSTHLCSVITIVNWNSYQTVCNKDNPPLTHMSTHTLTQDKGKSNYLQPISYQAVDNEANPPINPQTNHKQEVKEERIYRQIFDHWNSKGIVQHKRIEQSLPHIKARLKDYSKKEILEAIDNYSTIVHSQEYYFTYKWPLSSFLKQSNAFECFLTVNDPFSNYRVNGATAKAEPVAQQLDCSVCKYQNTNICKHCEEGSSKVNFQPKDNASC